MVAPGSSGLVQVVLDRRIGFLKETVIIRDQSAQRTIAGGVDPSPGPGQTARLTFLQIWKDRLYSALIALVE